MDSLAIRVPTAYDDFNYITINGIGIYDLMRFGRRKLGKKAAARDARKREKYKTDYLRVPHWLVNRPADRLFEHFYGGMLENITDHDRVMIYVCSCEDAGCGNYSALGSVDERVVRWTFEDDLGEFFFERQQYTTALENASLVHLEDPGTGPARFDAAHSSG